MTASEALRVATALSPTFQTGICASHPAGSSARLPSRSQRQPWNGQRNDPRRPSSVHSFVPRCRQLLWYALISPDDVRTTLYRVVQEALTNIAKHAPDATSVSVVLDRSDTTLQLTIEDDGHGFDAGAVRDAARKKGAGLGHAGMRERLALIGGELEIESSVGLGTTVYARVPLQHERLMA